MSKHFVIVVLTIFLLAGSASAQVSGYIELESLVYDGSVTPSLNLYFRGPIRGPWGWSAWSLTSEGWSEAYVGPTYAPADWVEFSLSVGVESDPSTFRYAGSVWMGRGRWALLSIHEDGGSGYWYKYLGTYRLNESAALGVFSQRSVGTGPYLELGKKFQVWGAVLFLDGETLGLIGGKINL